MKRIIVVLALLLSALSYGFSQLNHTDKIVEAYGLEWFNYMNVNNPDVIILLDKFANHGFIVQEMAPEKSSELKPLTEVPLRGKSGEYVTITEFINAYHSGNFNPLSYDFFPGTVTQSFRLEGTNYVIYILTQEVILQK